MSDHILQYSWQEICRDALAEMDPQERENKMEAARRAVLARLAELSFDEDDWQERDAIEYVLRLLKDFRLKRSA